MIYFDELTWKNCNGQTVYEIIPLSIKEMLAHKISLFLGNFGKKIASNYVNLLKYRYCEASYLAWLMAMKQKRNWT